MPHRKSKKSENADSLVQDAPGLGRSEIGAEPGIPLMSEQDLIYLAMRELRGTAPPGFFNGEVDNRKFNTPRPTSKTLLQRELDARGWTPRDLARAANLTSAEANALAKGNQRISADLARKFSRIFATSEEFWLPGSSQK